jgi:hypothetical protein
MIKDIIIAIQRDAKLSDLHVASSYPFMSKTPFLRSGKSPSITVAFLISNEHVVRQLDVLVSSMTMR